MLRFNGWYLGVFFLFQVHLSTGQVNCPEDPLFPFSYGVASGDATENSVVLWTKLDGRLGLPQVEVSWLVAADTSLSEILASGSGLAHANNDYTFKTEVENLTSGKWMYYRFSIRDYTSMTGRTRTFSNDQTPVSFAVFSCANYEQGFYNAYREALLDNDVQGVIHLGDYYYEYASGASSSSISGRTHEPLNECITLEDYRKRQARTNSDPDLMELRRNFPLYVIWDDHEISNDCWSTGSWSHNEQTDGPWSERKAAAQKAWFEWMPVRDNDEYRIYRSFEVGDLANFLLLDTRMEQRDAPVGSSSTELDDPERTLIGDGEMLWLQSELEKPNFQWTLVANQVIFSPLMMNKTTVMDPDMWDGFRFERDQLRSFMEENPQQNFIWITGDNHSSWAINIPSSDYDETLQSGSLGCEFVCPAVTSYPHTVPDIASFQSTNPHVEFIEQERNGFMKVTLTPDTAWVSWTWINTVSTKDYFVEEEMHHYIVRDDHFLKTGLSRPETVNDVPILQSGLRSEYTGEVILETKIDMVFPNPANDELFVVYHTPSCDSVEVSVVESSGRTVLMGQAIGFAGAPGFLKIDTGMFPAGIYFLRIGESVQRIEVIR